MKLIFRQPLSEHDRVNIQIRVATPNAINPIDMELDFFASAAQYSFVIKL